MNNFLELPTEKGLIPINTIHISYFKGTEKESNIYFTGEAYVRVKLSYEELKKLINK